MSEMLEGFSLAVRRALRGPVVNRLLQRMGIDPRRYWVLTDLFSDLAERREMMGNLGTNTAALKLNGWILCAMTGLLTVVLLFTQPKLPIYFAAFIGMTAFLMLGMLFSETGNSLVNPAEGLVLAHQPVGGATYTAAKLTHLARILLYLVPALNAIPAICGLLIGAPWYYPLLHLAAAFFVGAVEALLCCSVFGWLIRFVPPGRLKAAGQIAEIVPWTMFLLFQNSRSLLKNAHIPHWLPTGRVPLVSLAAACLALSIVAVVMGLRSLSGDYLVRISAIVHGGSGAKSKVRRSRASDLVSRLFGGPPSRAGFEYVSRMMRRDWQFRRQLIPMIPGMVGIIALSTQNWRSSPFSTKFTGAHVLPHLFGVILFWICPLMKFGSDYKGTWLFLLAPTHVFDGFARGVYAWLWLRIVILPHVVLLLTAVLLWGLRDGVLFTAYSVTVASFYLALEVRLIDGIPFSKQPQPTRQNYLLPLMFMGMAVMGAAVAVQYFVLFHFPLAVLGAAVVLGAGAWLITRNSIETFATSIRFNLSVLTEEAKGIFTEIEV